MRTGRQQGSWYQRQLCGADGERLIAVDLDLEKFFDRVNHDILMGRLARGVNDKRLLRIIRRPSAQHTMSIARFHRLGLVSLTRRHAELQTS